MPSLLGKGNQEAKKAGLNQGSHRMLPWLVSTNSPACPRNVIRIVALDPVVTWLASSVPFPLETHPNARGFPASGRPATRGPARTAPPSPYSLRGRIRSEGNGCSEGGDRSTHAIVGK